VFSAAPPISISLPSAKIIKPPHPPFPGLPLQAPSVAASIALFCLLLINLEPIIEIIG